MCYLFPFFILFPRKSSVFSFFSHFFSSSSWFLTQFYFDFLSKECLSHALLAFFVYLFKIEKSRKTMTTSKSMHLHREDNNEDKPEWFASKRFMCDLWSRECFVLLFFVTTSTKWRTVRWEWPGWLLSFLHYYCTHTFAAQNLLIPPFLLFMSRERTTWMTLSCFKYNEITAKTSDIFFYFPTDFAHDCVILAMLTKTTPFCKVCPLLLE